MWHPFIGFAPQTLMWWLFFLGMASVICFFTLVSLDRRLRNRFAPHGMVSLQLADTGAECRRIVDSWGEVERELAQRNLTLDYLFIPLYTTSLGIMSILAAHGFASQGWTGMSSAAVAMAWGQWGVALFDIAENSALLRTLQMSPDIPDHLARFTCWCARLKFLLVMLAVLCSLFSLLTQGA